MASFVETHGHAADEGNFEALYATYKSDVQRLASYLLKNASDAEDAAQTVFLNVLRALRQGVTPSDPRAWLLAITRNVCFSRHRAAAARPDYVELDPEVPMEPSGEETPSADEIVGALARLLPNQRTALILRDFRGVSRSEICNLMALSPVAVEALLTRARAAFREELQAGEQQFECAETRAFVEQQLDGLITVADRHSLRSHLRHCGPCSTLARAVRSSRGKLAGLLFWPVDLISRLAAAFSQAPSVAHVAAGITSAAAVAAVAIPVAVTTSSGGHERTDRSAAFAPVAVVAPAPAAARPAAHVARAVSRPTTHVVAPAAKPTAHVSAHPRAARPAAHSPARAKTTNGKTVPAPVTHTTTNSAGTATTGRTSTPTTRAAAPSPAPSAAPAATPSATPVAAASNAPSPGLVTPTSAPSPRSPSPILRAPAKPKAPAPTRPRSKPRAKQPTHKSPKRGGRHAPSPPATMPPSASAPNLPPPENGAVDGAGPGITLGSDTTPAAVVPPPPATTGQNGAGNDGGSSNPNGRTADTGQGNDPAPPDDGHGKKPRK